MSSTHAQPFSYLSGGVQTPKTGFRKEDGQYGSRIDMAKPIPALRHDQPRRAADWSIDQRLRGGEQTPAERRRATPARDAAGDTESVLPYGNVRLPRADVSLYQSQIDGPAFGNSRSSPSLLTADTPAGHYSNRSSGDMDDVARRVDDLAPKANKPQAGGGVFDNFILKGPGIQASSGNDVRARRTVEERPRSPRSRLDRLFDDHSSSSSDVAPPTRRPQDAEVGASHPPRRASTIHGTDSTALYEPNHIRADSFRVTTSGPNGFDDTKLPQQSPVTKKTATSDCCRRRCCCCGYSGVYCSHRRMCILVVVAVFVALLMLGVGFVAGWFAVQQMQQQQVPGSSAAAAGQNESTSTSQSQTKDVSSVTPPENTTSTSTTTTSTSTTTTISRLSISSTSATTSVKITTS